MQLAQPSVGLDASPTGLRSLAFGRDPTASLGTPGERPVSALALGKKLEDSKRVTGSSGPGLQFPWSERAGLGAAC